MDTKTAWGHHTLGSRDCLGTHKNEELGRRQGEGSITAFLDCSKCYERVSHDKAYNRMIQTGCHPNIANLVMDLYQGQRRIKVHGATSAPLTAKARLIAGCAFAKDVLKAFLEPIQEVMKAERRDYVDEITIIARGIDHKDTIPFFLQQLGEANNLADTEQHDSEREERADLCEQQQIQKQNGNKDTQTTQENW